MFIKSDINHEVVPILNKIDLPASDIEKTKKQIEDVIGITQRMRSLLWKNWRGYK